MKNNTIIFLLSILLSFASFAQFISRQIINEYEKLPIFGITIYSDGLPMPFSD